MDVPPVLTDDPPATTAGRVAPRSFLSTSWTVVLKASQPTDGRLALEELCRLYWFPIYGYLRRSGLSVEHAEDVTQSFFAWLIESNVVARADRSRGRFRTFLIVAVRQYLSRHRQYENAAKRKPPQGIVALDSLDAENRLRIEPCHEATPERAFEYSWAISVMEQAMARLRGEWEQAGRGDRFQVLKGSLVKTEESSGRELANQLGISEGAVRVAITRLRKRFGEIIRDEIQQTLGPDEDVEDELRSLGAALRF